MPDILKMGLVLTVVGLVCTGFLALVEQKTREPIAAAKQAEIEKSLKAVLPQGYDNQPVVDAAEFADKRLNAKASPVKFYRARKGSETLGAAFVVTAPDGYAGDIAIMMAVAPGGTVLGAEIVAHKETPGLGDKYNHPWIDAFQGKTLKSVKWGVKKDGGDFSNKTGATVTPRAIVKAVKRGLEFYAENEANILAPAPAASPPAAPAKAGG
ncbi:MAG: RnfABCDGE type electron transport complex subunit G [Magnetococcales bacterium]|nr:RnfABCDGE type electron transport complex subunit G [Magnetococcales bacterium]